MGASCVSVSIEPPYGIRATTDAQESSRLVKLPPVRLFFEGSLEGHDFIVFGLCDLGFPELGYVSLNEMPAIRGPLGLSIEPDLRWTPKTLEKCE